MTQKQAHKQGQKAAKDGKALADNPHQPCTYGCTAWRYGFLGKAW